MSSLTIKRNIAEDTVSVTVTDHALLASLEGRDLTLDGIIARLIGLRLELGGGDVPIYDGTGCPLSGASLYEEDDGKPKRVVAW